MERSRCLTIADKLKCNLQRISIGVTLIVALLLLNACATLQKDFPRSESYALEPGPGSAPEGLCPGGRTRFSRTK